MESSGCSCVYGHSFPTILPSLDLLPVIGGEPVRNLWSVAFSNARGTLIGCAPSSSTSTFATSVLEIDPATGLTTSLASVNGTSVRDVVAIQDSSFFFLVATRQGKELIRLSLDTLKEDNLFLPQLQHLVHLSWDERRNQLLGVSVSQAAVSVVKIDWSHASMVPVVDLAAHVPPMYLSALHGSFRATSRPRLLATDQDVFLMWHSQSRAEMLIFGLLSHHLVSFPIANVMNVVELAPAPALKIVRPVPDVLGIAGEGDMHVEGRGFGRRPLSATLLLTRRPAVGEEVRIHSLKFENAFHFNGKVATVTADDEDEYMTVLLSNGKQIKLLPAHLESRVAHLALSFQEWNLTASTRPCDESWCNSTCNQNCIITAVTYSDMINCEYQCYVDFVNRPQSVAASWISDTSLSARVQAMPQAKYNMIVKTRNSQSSSASVAFKESWLEFSPRFAATAGDSIFVTGLGFRDSDTYFCRWNNWNATTSAVFEYRATQQSKQNLSCLSPPWPRNVAPQLYCDAFVCEGLLSLDIYSQEHGLLPGPLHQKQRLIRMSPANLSLLTVLEYPPRPIVAAAEQRYVLAARDDNGFNILSANIKIQVTAEEESVEMLPHGYEEGLEDNQVLLLGETEVMAIRGVAIFHNLRPAHASKPYRLTFTCSTCASSLPVTASVHVFTVPFGVPVRLSVEQLPREIVAGSAFAQPPRVFALDAYGNKVLDFSAEIHVQLLTVNTSFPDAELIGMSTALASLGVAIFDLNLSVQRDGFYQLNFSSPFLKSATSRVFQVRPARAESLYAQFVHYNLSSMKPIGPLEVSVRDAYGNLVPADYTISATLEQVDASHPSGFKKLGKLLGVTEAVAVAGTAHFTSLLITTARAGYVLQFRHGVLHAQTMAFTVKPGSCFRMSIATQPDAAFAVLPFLPQPRLIILDLANNTAHVSVSVNVSLLLNASELGPNGALRGTVNVSTRVGVAIFTDLAITQVTASATLIFHSQSPCGFLAVSEPFPVMPSKEQQIFIAAQPSEGRGGKPFSVRIHLLDAGGNLVELAAINVFVSLKTIHADGIGSDRASATLIGAAQVKSVKGIAMFEDLVIDVTGFYRLEFSSAGLPSVTGNMIIITVGEASYLEYDTAHPICNISNSQLAGCFVDVPITPRVCVRDKGGNLVPNSGLTLRANLTTFPDGYSVHGLLSGSVFSGALSDSCFNFTNLWVYKASGPYVMQFSVIPQARPARHFVHFPCTSKNLVAPACEAFIPLVPASRASEMQVSVRVANSDFADSDEHVTSVWIGNEPLVRLGGPFLVFDGEDNNCAKMSLILDGITVPWGRLSVGGQLRVRVETSAKVGGVQCLNASTLYAEISVSWFPESVEHAFSGPIVVQVGKPAVIGFLARPSNAVAGRAFSPQVVVELRDVGGNRVVEHNGAYEVVVKLGCVEAGCNSSCIEHCIVDAGTDNISFAICQYKCASNGKQESVAAQRILGTTEQAVVRGLAVFSDLALSLRTASQTMIFTAYLPGSITSNTTVLAALESNPFSVGNCAGDLGKSSFQCPAIALVLSRNPGNGVGGELLSVQPMVSIVDTGGILAANMSGLVSVTLQTTVPAHLYGSIFARVNNSLAIFTDLVVDAAASGYTLVFSFPNLTDIVSLPFNVSEGSAFRLSTTIYRDVGEFDTAILPRSVLLTLHVSLTFPCPFVCRSNFLFFCAC